MTYSFQQEQGLYARFCIWEQTQAGGTLDQQATPKGWLTSLPPPTNVALPPLGIPEPPDGPDTDEYMERSTRFQAVLETHPPPPAPSSSSDQSRNQKRRRSTRLLEKANAAVGKTPPDEIESPDEDEDWTWEGKIMI